ncbi:UNVERIFIED_CONTAM: hypothetical protein FKN15_048486 [Acipenser sinensis]
MEGDYVLLSPLTPGGDCPLLPPSPPSLHRLGLPSLCRLFTDAWGCLCTTAGRGMPWRSFAADLQGFARVEEASLGAVSTSVDHIADSSISAARGATGGGTRPAVSISVDRISKGGGPRYVGSISAAIMAQAGGASLCTVSLSADSTATGSIDAARIASAGTARLRAVSTSADCIAYNNISAARVCAPTVSFSTASGATGGGPYLADSISTVSSSTDSIAVHGPLSQRLPEWVVSDQSQEINNREVEFGEAECFRSAFNK